MERQRHSRSIAPDVHIRGRHAVGANSQKYSTTNNINLNASEHLHPLPYHHHHQQQCVEMDGKELMRRKLTQWYQWQRRYGILASIFISHELRRPNPSTITSQPVIYQPLRSQSSIALPRHATSSRRRN